MYKDPTHSFKEFYNKGKNRLYSLKKEEFVISKTVTMFVLFECIFHVLHNVFTLDISIRFYIIMCTAILEVGKQCKYLYVNLFFNFWRLYVPNLKNIH